MTLLIYYRKRNRGGIHMVKVGYASLGSNGKVSGDKLGDNNGREVKVTDWYNFGQDTVYRFKDRNKAAQFADTIQKAINNNNIGYDQSRRLTFYNALVKANGDPAMINTPCACDCSSLVAACLRSVRIDVSEALTTTYMSNIMKTNEFIVITNATDPEILMTGDIINAAGHHVVVALNNGSNFDKVNEYTYGSIKWAQCQLRKVSPDIRNIIDNSGGIDGVNGAQTKLSIRKAQSIFGIKVDGIAGSVTCKYLARY